MNHDHANLRGVGKLMLIIVAVLAVFTFLFPLMIILGARALAWWEKIL